MISAASGCFAPSAEKATISGKPSAVARLGQDPQALGEEQPFGPPRLLVAERTQPLHGGLEKAVTWRGIILPRTAP